LDAGGIVERSVDCHDIETHGPVPILTASSEKQRGRHHQPTLLRGTDRLYCVYGTARLPVTDFDEDEAVAVRHNEVDFAETAAKIAPDQFEALLFQPGKRQGFGVVAKCPG
jgi:hypothetical protein